MVVGRSAAALNQVAYARSPSPAKWLARNATCHKVYRPDTPRRDFLQKVGRVRQIAAPAETREVCFVGMNCPLFGIRAHQHVKPRPLEANREASGTAEQVDSCRSTGTAPEKRSD
jgi:hypothetical protein